MHGLHPRPKGGEDFQSQLRDSMEWLEQRGGGLLLGDFNRVVCCKWRCGNRVELNSGDRALRKAARWGCECCVQADDSEEEARMVRGPGGRETPTRFTTACGKWGNGTARLDGAIAVGGEEGRWAVVEEVFPERSGAGDTAIPLSDHLLIELKRGGVGPRAELEQRPVAVRLDGSAMGRETAAAYAAVASGPGFAEQLGRDAAAAQARGEAGTASVTGALRALGEQVAGEVQGARRETVAAAGKDGSGGTAYANYHRWAKRLGEAQRLRREQADPMALASNMLLFHPKTGLRKILMELCGRGAPGQVVWDAVVRRCRRLSHQAQLARGKQLRHRRVRLWRRLRLSWRRQRIRRQRWRRFGSW